MTTPVDLKNAINAELRAGHLADLGSPMDLGLTGVMVLHRLTERLPPLKSWQKRAGWKPVNETDLKGEIRSEFARLLDQIKEMPLEANDR